MWPWTSGGISAVTAPHVAVLERPFGGTIEASHRELVLKWSLFLAERGVYLATSAALSSNRNPRSRTTAALWQRDVWPRSAFLLLRTCGELGR